MERLRDSFLASGKAVSGRHRGKYTEVKVADFVGELRAASKNSKSKPKVEIEQNVEGITQWECSLHFIKNCSSCRDTFGEAVEEDDDDWMSASLNFAKSVGANVYAPKIDDYTVEDPRAAAKAKGPDIFGRDIKAGGDLKGKQNRNWAEKSTRSVRNEVDQAKEAPGMK